MLSVTHSQLHRLKSSPQNLSKAREYDFEIFFSRYGIQLANEQNVVFRFYFSIW